MFKSVMFMFMVCLCVVSTGTVASAQTPPLPDREAIKAMQEAGMSHGEIEEALGSSSVQPATQGASTLSVSTDCLAGLSPYSNWVLWLGTSWALNGVDSAHDFVYADAYCDWDYYYRQSCVHKNLNERLCVYLRFVTCWEDDEYLTIRKTAGKTGMFMSKVEGNPPRYICPDGSQVDYNNYHVYCLWGVTEPYTCTAQDNQVCCPAGTSSCDFQDRYFVTAMLDQGGGGPNPSGLIDQDIGQFYLRIATDCP